MEEHNSEDIFALQEEKQKLVPMKITQTIWYESQSVWCTYCAG